MKKTTSIILSIVILLSLGTLSLASSSYNVNSAIEYAAKHVNDNDGSQCAEFVSKCVQAGGLNVPINTGTYSCWNAILNASGLSGENLVLNSKGYATKQDNVAMLNRGDVVVQWCYTCNLRPHILICGGYDSEGYATFYAHNSALDNKRYNFSKNSQHEESCNIGAKVVQLSKLNNNVSSDSKSTPDNDTKANDSSLKQKCGDNVYWTLDNNGILTISGTGEMYDYNFAQSPWFYYENETVCEIASKIKEINIIDGVTRIGDSAFFKLENVKKITIPKSVKSVGDATFGYVNNVDEVYYNAVDCKYLGETLGYAYNYFACGNKLIIGPDVKSIGENVFFRAEFNEVVCSGNLNSILLDPAGNEVLLNNVPDNISIAEKCGDNAYWTLDDNGVLTIGGSGTMYDFDDSNSTPWASKHDKIHHVTIEDLITNIGEQSFSFCNNLYTVDLGNGVQEIGAWAFNNTKNLKEIIIPETLSMLRKYAFGGLTNINDIYYRGKESDWKSIIIEEGNKGIVDSNIHYNSINENLLPDEQVPNDESDLIAYGKCGKDINWKLKSNGVLAVDGNGAIEWYQPWSDVPWYPYAAKIKHVVFGDGITEINQTLFYSCNQIKTISFGNGITEINNGLLYECKDSVEKILIGKGIKTIGYEFNENISIYYAGSENEWNNINFFDEVNESAIKIPYPIAFGCSKLPEIDSFTDDGIQVIVKNSLLSMDQPPILKDGRTLVPLRAIFEALNVPVEWNGSEQKVTATKGTTTIWLTIGDNAIHINDKTIPLDVSAQIVNGRTLIPVRAVAEALDCTVNWNGNKKYVIIIPKNEKKYRIDAVNTKGEVLSSVHFNAGGLIESIDNFGYYDWFLPYYANINGNFYLQDINLLSLNSSQIQFEYQNGNLSKITTGSMEINYKYDSNNRAISNGKEILYINKEIKNNGYIFKENILGLVNEFYPENEEYLHHTLLYDARGKITTYQMNTDMHTYEYKDDGSLYCSYYQEYTPGEDTPYKTKEKVFYKYTME